MKKNSDYADRGQLTVSSLLLGRRTETKGGNQEEGVPDC